MTSLLSEVGVPNEFVEITSPHGHDAFLIHFDEVGQPIADFQAVSHRLADMKLRHDNSRLQLYRAAALFALGRPSMEAAALAERSKQQCGPLDIQRAEWLIQTVYSRPASTEETSLALEFVYGYEDDEPDPWTALAHALLAACGDRPQQHHEARGQAEAAMKPTAQATRTTAPRAVFRSV